MTKRRLDRLAAALTVVLCMGGSSPGLATVLLEADVAALTQEAEAVVHARVIDMRSAWNPERTMIFTWVMLDAIQTLRGAHRSRVVVRVPGGTVDGYTIEMSGAPQFPKQGNVVAFLGSWDDGAARVVGYFQGLSQVVADRLGNPMLRGGSAEGLSLPQLAERLRQSAGKGR